MQHGLRDPRVEDRRRASISSRSAIAVLALVIGVLAGVFAQPAIARKRPDLVMAQSKASGRPPYVFKGGDRSFEFQFEDVTKNVGDATAPASRTRFYLVPQHQGRGTVRHFLGSREVPKLSPGATNGGHAEVRLGSDLQLGAYVLLICADSRDPIAGGRGVVRESSERNNCDSTGRRFYVIKRTWQGSLSGVGGIGSAAKAERWHSTGASTWTTRGTSATASSSTIFSGVFSGATAA